MAKYFTPREVAERLGVSLNQLSAWRAAKPQRGPNWVRLVDAPNGPVRYTDASLEAWEAELVQS